MRRDVAVFVGPTLTSDDRESLSDICRVHGPARWGDLDRVSQDVATVVLIDGVMVNAHPPSVKEVFRLASRACVIGSSSLGALRAVELERVSSMVGLGWVYRQFRDRRVTADDEVLAALSDTGDALTIPLVNVRHLLEQLVGQSVASDRAASQVMTELKGQHFSTRSPAVCCEAFKRAGLEPSSVDDLASNNVKRTDALAALAEGGVAIS